MKKIWLQNYPSSVPSSLPPLKKNIIEEFEEVCKKFQDKKAFVSFNTSLSYRELYKKSCQFAYYLKENDFKPPCVIAIQLPNILQYPVVLWGSLIAGVKIVNMNPLFTAREMLLPLQETQAKGIILLPNKLKDLKSILNQTKLKQVIVTKVGDLLNSPQKHFTNLAFKYKTKTWKDISIKNKVSFLSTLKNSPLPIDQLKKKRKENETVFIQYTGGTTGVIKGACLTEKNILSNAKQCQLWMNHWIKEGEEKALMALPLSHIFSLVVNGLTFFLSGHANVLILNPRDIKSLVKTMKKENISIGTGVNTLFKSILSHKNFESINFSTLKIFVAGGMPLELSVKNTWESKTKSLLVEGYGLTEASPVVCVERLDHQRDNSSGYPLPSTEIRITNEKNQELSFNQIGELEIKGPQVMKGYYNQEKETKKVLSPEGWLKTGDIAKINAKGSLQILGRKKEIINISGLKVYPREVEEILLNHPKVKEVAVIKGNSIKNQEIVKAYIVKKQASLTEKEILLHCKKNLSPYKVPKEIIFCKNFLKNLIGKPLKQLLK